MQDHENTTIGGVTWHSSQEDGGPDVGISVYLGKDDRLWAGEVTSKLFNENDGAANFVSDGGWFLIRYKGEETKLIAKFGDGLEAREFIEEVASWHVRLALKRLTRGSRSGGETVACEIVKKWIWDCGDSLTLGFVQSELLQQRIIEYLVPAPAASLDATNHRNAHRIVGSDLSRAQCSNLADAILALPADGVREARDEILGLIE